MEKQNEQRGDFKDQSEKDNQWSKKNEPHHDQTKEENQQGSDADVAASIPGTQPNDGASGGTRNSQQQESDSVNQSDLKELKDHHDQTKDSDHKEENAANAKDTSGHY